MNYEFGNEDKQRAEPNLFELWRGVKEFFIRI